MKLASASNKSKRSLVDEQSADETRTDSRVVRRERRKSAEVQAIGAAPCLPQPAEISAPSAMAVESRNRLIHAK